MRATIYRPMAEGYVEVYRDGPHGAILVGAARNLDAARRHFGPRCATEDCGAPVQFGSTRPDLCRDCGDEEAGRYAEP